MKWIAGKLGRVEWYAECGRQGGRVTPRLDLCLSEKTVEVWIAYLYASVSIVQ